MSRSKQAFEFAAHKNFFIYLFQFFFIFFFSHSSRPISTVWKSQPLRGLIFSIELYGVGLVRLSLANTTHPQQESFPQKHQQWRPKIIYNRSIIEHAHRINADCKMKVGMAQKHVQPNERPFGGRIKAQIVIQEF